MRKKVDARLRTLIENGVELRHRGLIVIVGDNAREQVVNLHYMLSKAAVKARPSVLWCYKKELGFTTHRKKRMRHIKKMAARGLIDPEKDDPFELFISSTSISCVHCPRAHHVRLRCALRATPNDGPGGRWSPPTASLQVLLLQGDDTRAGQHVRDAGAAGL